MNEIEKDVVLHFGDCLDIMGKIPDGSIDMILSDIPFGITQCKWDKVIPLEPLWEQYRRICKTNAAIVLFGVQPFSSTLILSNPKMFKYEWIWLKTQPVGFYNAKKAPLRIHENVLVFYQKQPVYNPQKWFVSQEKIKSKIGRIHRNSDYKKTCGEAYGHVSKASGEAYEYKESCERYPVDVIKFSNWNGALFGNSSNAVKHPTQKPIPLLEYLIKTYTNVGEIVFDGCMGSGSTGVACKNTGRRFIGIEKDKKIYEIARSRIACTGGDTRE